MEERHGRCLARHLASGQNGDATAISRLADLQQQLLSGERRATELTEEVVALRRHQVTPAELACTADLLDGPWQSMSRSEQARAPPPAPAYRLRGRHHHRHLQRRRHQNPSRRANTSREQPTPGTYSLYFSRSPGDDLALVLTNADPATWRWVVGLLVTALAAPAIFTAIMCSWASPCGCCGIPFIAYTFMEPRIFPPTGRL